MLEVTIKGSRHEILMFLEILPEEVAVPTEGHMVGSRDMSTLILKVNMHNHPTLKQLNLNPSPDETRNV